MEPTVAEAAANIRKAVEGRPPRSYAEVSAEDVVAVGESIPPAKRTGTTDALVGGAKNALGGRGNPDLRVYQLAYQLAALLEAAGQ